MRVRLNFRRSWIFTDPPRTAGINLVGTILVDFSECDLNIFDSIWRKGKKLYALVFSVKIEYGSKQGVLRFSTWVDNREVGATSIKYGKN
jgi:hypothetical protein